MRLRSRYLLVGIAWSLLLAPITAYALLGAVAGALWIYVYGDNPWPAGTDWIIPLVGLVVFTTTAALCISFSYSYGRQREVAGKGEDPQERKAVLLLTLAPLALLVITSIAFWQRGLHWADEAAAIERREAAFNDWLDARHQIAEFAAHRTVGNSLEATITTSGGRGGSYDLLWELRDMVYREVLVQAAEDVELGTEATALSFEISINELADNYRNAVLSGDGVLVDEQFELLVALVPVIDQEDLEVWPSYERDQWERGETPLRSTAATQVQLRFRVEHDGTVNYWRP